MHPNEWHQGAAVEVRGRVQAFDWFEVVRVEALAEDGE